MPMLPEFNSNWGFSFSSLPLTYQNSIRLIEFWVNGKMIAKTKSKYADYVRNKLCQILPVSCNLEETERILIKVDND